MATVSNLFQYPCKSLSLTTPQTSQFPSRSSVVPLGLRTTTNSIFFSSSRLVKKGPLKVRPLFLVRAVDEGEEGKEEEDGSAVAVVDEQEEPTLVVTETYTLKKQLVDSFYGTSLGLNATSETRAEIVELITQLEAKNPTPAPTEALTLLHGKWILASVAKNEFINGELEVERGDDFNLSRDGKLIAYISRLYTSFVGLFPLLSRGTLPLVKVEEISQTIDSENLTVQNSVLFAGPLATTSISTNAKFEIRSPKRVQIKFEEGVIGTPQLTDSIVIPESVEFLGQKIDLAPFRGLITSLQDTASSVAKTISNQPPLKFSFSSSNAESWLLTTYLDDDLRISRGDGGSVFVLIKEGSSLLTP